MRPRSYKSFKDYEKAEMYALAQNKTPDDEIMARFSCSEDVMYQCISDVFIALRQQMGFTGFSRHS